MGRYGKWVQITAAASRNPAGVSKCFHRLPYLSIPLVVILYSILHIKPGERRGLWKDAER